ncbi:hypothetical protein N9547_00735 [bacterium]|nr:hypothetical protein [bacterium]
MNATSKLVKAWESKNAKNAAKAGGISLMALSLAACGGSSTTTTTATDTTTTTPVVVQGLTFALSSAADILDPNSATAATTTTAGDDTFRAAATGDFTSADIIDGGDGNDTLTAEVTEGATGSDVTIKPMLTSVENVKVTMTAVANDTTTTLNFADSTGVTAVEVVNANDADVTVSGITTATAVTISNTAGATLDSVNTITLTGLSTATDGGQDSYTVNLTDTDAADIVIAGVEAITINAAGKAVDIADLSADALESLTITGGVVDATVTTEAVVIGSGTAVAFAGLEAADAATIDASAATSAVTITMASDDDDDLVATGGAGKLTLTMTGTDNNGAVTLTSGTGGIDATLVSGDNAATATSITSVSVTGSAVADAVDISAVANPTDITATAADESKSVNATVSTGAGNDTITINAGVVNVDAGAGDDTLVVGTTSNITGGATAAVDIITLGDGTDTISTADATLNASDKTWVGYIGSAEVLKTTAAGTKAIDLDLVDASAITAASVSAHTAVNGATAGTTGTGSAGGAAVTFTSSNANGNITVSADLTGQAGQEMTTGTSGAGGAGLALAATVDGGANEVTLTLVDDTDIKGGASGAANAGTTGTSGAGISAAEIDTLNIVLSATDTTADAVSIDEGAVGTDAGIAIATGVVGGDVVVAANATINISEVLSGTATATKESDLDLNDIVGTNVTVNASGIAGNITITSTQGNATVTTGSGVDTLTLTEGGLDTVNLGAGDDVYNHTGGAVDVITLGAGDDTINVGAAYDNSTDAFTVVDFEAGAANDVITIDVSEVDGATANLVDSLDATNYIEGSLGTVGANDVALAVASNSVMVLTGNSYATYAAVETELVVEAGGNLTDIAVVFLNSTSGVAEMYVSDTTANATNDFLMASFSNMTSLTDLEVLTTDNITHI